MTDPSALYIDLLKRCLTRELFDEHYRIIPHSTKTTLKAVRSTAYAAINRAMGAVGLALVQKGIRRGETMIGPEALDNIDFCVRSILADNVAGDFIETGVWKGGSCILMRGLLEVLEPEGDRRVFLADSFQGLPKSNPDKYPEDRGLNLWADSLDISVEEVKANFQRYKLLDDRVVFLPGWFKDTLPNAPIERLSLLRLDGDLYESTIQALENLYPKLSPGGYCIIDDYGCFDACAKAVHDYRDRQGITEPIKRVDWSVVFWRRTPAS
jgi:hypothetical protein